MVGIPYTKHMVKGHVRVNITATPRGAYRLDRFLTAEKRKARRAAEAYARRHDLAQLAGPAAAAVKASIRDRAQARRDALKLFDTQDLAVAEAVRRELETLGLDLANLPETEAGFDLPGRPLGASGIPGGVEMAATIPRSHFAGVAAAAWLASKPVIYELREWDQRHGYDPTVPGGLLTPDQWAARQEITSRITTRGDIYRRALETL